MTETRIYHGRRRALAQVLLAAVLAFCGTANGSRVSGKAILRTSEDGRLCLHTSGIKVQRVRITPVDIEKKVIADGSGQPGVPKIVPVEPTYASSTMVPTRTENVQHLCLDKMIRGVGRVRSAAFSRWKEQYFRPHRFYRITVYRNQKESLASGYFLWSGSRWVDASTLPLSAGKTYREYRAGAGKGKSPVAAFPGAAPAEE